MRVDEYQEKAVLSDQSKGSATARYLLLGLFGEAGGVLTAVKKRERDKEAAFTYLTQIKEELGDLLWYIAAVAHRNDTKLSSLVAPLLTHSVMPQMIEFSHLQHRVTFTSLKPSRHLELRLVRLASAVGDLVQKQTESLHTRITSSADEAFTEVFRRILDVANRVGVSLEEVVSFNLDKVNARWPSVRKYPARFDGGYPSYEQLPHKMVIDIREVVNGKNQYFVLQTCNNIHVGDRLTDNIADPDEYRFHDVFHYAYAAILGWSPVMRSLLRLKRKSDKSIDEAQDGARAVLIEEGISTLVFNEAKRQDFFRDVQPGRLSFDLLKTIKAFVRGYEVEDLPYWLWEDAILQGFQAFRFLQEHRAARVTIVSSTRKLEVAPHP